MKACLTSAIVLFFAVSLAAANPQREAAVPSLQKFTFAEPHLGTIVQIQVYAPEEGEAKEGAAAAFARIAELNRILSDYDPESELMRLVRSAKVGQRMPASSDFCAVLDASLQLARRTKGAFDPTLSPVIQLWRRARRTRELPQPALLEAALQRVGYQFVTVDTKAGTVTIQKEGLRLDFGGIAKGHIAEEALKVLREKGLSRSLVAISGDIAAGDTPPGEPGWRVGIAPLDKPDGQPSRFLKLVNMAVSTSGDAYQSVEIAGIRYSHIIDPKTGVGLIERRSVTVVAPHGMQADGLDTAALILGPQAGLKLIADTPDCAGLYLEAGPDGLIAHETERLKAFFWPETEEIPSANGSSR